MSEKLLEMIQADREARAEEELGTPGPLELTPGKFYRSRAGDVWCCFKVDPTTAMHKHAYCIRLADSRIEYFYTDGRYDVGGTREHCLEAEASFDDFEKLG